MSTHPSCQTEIVVWSTAGNASQTIEVWLVLWAVSELRVGSLVVNVVRFPFVERMPIEDQVRRVQVSLPLLAEHARMKIWTEYRSI